MKIASEQSLAVVTGAAGGLGLAFANQLADRGYRLLLVDRRQAQLEQVCDSIAGRYGVSAEPYAIDLCQREEVQRLAKKLTQTDVELLVNNAGFGTVDYFVDTDPNFLLGMVDVHVVAPTILTRAVLPRMIERNSGAIINVSSLGAFLHSAGNTGYGSTKNYLTVFSQSLNQELRGTNVCVQALCPGFVRTGFHSAESMKGFHQCAPAPRMWMSADKVVECSLRRLGGRQVVVIPGLKFRILGRLAQMPLLQPLMQWITRVPRQASSTMPSPSAVERPAAEPSFRIAKQA
jgi:uncharacterized protein